MSIHKPYDTPQWHRPPRALFFLHGASFFVSVLIFVTSFPEFGRSSLYLNVAIPFFTMIFHGTILLLAYRRPQSKEATLSPATKLASIGFACFFAIGWAAAMAMCIVTIYIIAPGYRYFEFLVGPGFFYIVLQLLLDLIALLLMVSIAIVANRRRREQKATMEPYNGDWYAL